jgi:hypothetical protein
LLEPYAATRGTYGSEGGSAGQPADPTRQNAATVLGVLRERGRRGLPLEGLCRQLFNPQLYLLAYGRIYANQGAMTPGVTQETVDGMSQAKIGRIIDAMRHERCRFAPVRRVYIPKKSGKTRSLGLPT